SSMISTVLNVDRSIRAIRGVLCPLINSQRPSSSPLVLESSVWWASSHGTKPCDVFSIGFVSSEYPHPFSGFWENTGITLRSRPEGMPYAATWPLKPPEANIYSSSCSPGATYTFWAASVSVVWLTLPGLQADANTKADIPAASIILRDKGKGFICCDFYVVSNSCRSDGDILKSGVPHHLTHSEMSFE